MSLRQLPTINAFDGLSGVATDAPAAAMERWNGSLRAATEGDPGVISIYEVIGEDWWTGGGVTSKRVAGALRAIGNQPVTVMINSPGGDMFEGIAIYSLLKEHPAQVTVKIVGLAASAASVIAMAGDRIEIARAGFLMIHNCWILAAGNRHDMRELADLLQPFDTAMADLYAARTGQDMAAVGEMMDRETWLGGSQAIEQGFADALLPSDEVAEDDAGASAMAGLAAIRRVDAALARTGMPRTERRGLIRDLKSGTPGAAAPEATSGADLTTLAADLRRLFT